MSTANDCVLRSDYGGRRLPLDASSTFVTAILNAGSALHVTAGEPLLATICPTTSTVGSILKIVTNVVHGSPS